MEEREIAGPPTTASSPTRIVFLGHGAERTGPPILLADLLEGLAPDPRWSCEVIVARDGPLVERYRRSAGRTRTVTSGREPLEPLAAGLRRAGAAGMADRVTAAATARAVRGALPADIVYVNGATPPTAALLRAVDPGPDVVVILHVHELGVGLHRNLDPDDLRLLLDRADHIIAVSQPVADLLIGRHRVDPATVTVCEGFVDTTATVDRQEVARRALAIPDDAPVIGSVGLPDWRKDPDHLLRVAATIGGARAPAPWVVWVGGDPAGADGVRAADEAERLGLADRWLHVAHRPDAVRLLGAFDVFALPAREDALPLAALEAGAARLPIVCFRTGGIAALCDAGAGSAVGYPDTAAFAAALTRYLDDAELREATGQRAAALVADRHSIAIGVERIARVLVDAARSQPPRR